MKKKKTKTEKQVIISSYDHVIHLLSLYPVEKESPRIQELTDEEAEKLPEA